MKKISVLFLLMIFIWSCNNSQKNNEEQNKQEKIIKVELNVEGMTCTGCENTIQNNVKELDGVKEIKADHTKGNAIVSFDQNKLSVDDIKNTIENKGYKVVANKEL